MHTVQKDKKQGVVRDNAKKKKYMNACLQFGRQETIGASMSEVGSGAVE